MSGQPDSGQQNDYFDQFRENYARTEHDVLTDIERLVIGESYGANGYTTRAQADMIGDRLELGPDRLLLDVGSGCGWPGLYLAATTGCRVVVTDVPLEGLQRAGERVRTDTLAAGVVACSAPQPPFRDTAFDAISHTDVLC